MSMEEQEKDSWEFPYIRRDGPMMTTSAYPKEHCLVWDQCLPYWGNQADSYQDNHREDQSVQDQKYKAHRREKNRQASVRYRQKQQQLRDHLEAENRRMEEEIKELESRLNRGLEELAILQEREGLPCI